ncbi:MAG TPA: glycoside hydrolase family 43 protein [Anaerohalosphaeraceae bacterium]|nr:glycoside hydrolase family 43 protein [Anaerohalosphaeraceae bacterium]
MNKTTVLRVLLCCLLQTMSFVVIADYPIISNRYLADPAALVHEDRVYVYCSNDDESPVQGGYNIPNVVCISTADMKNWTDHGIVFDAARDTTWAKKSWAPTAIARDGKIFLYFGNGGANIGVAVADSPTGPFKEVLGKPLLEHSTPGVQPARNMWLFDPGAFIDDDGQAYLYFGGNGDDNVRVVKLKRDMITLDGDVIKMNAQNFFEAAWVFKRNGIYYFTYSANPRAGMSFDYMTSTESPISGFTYAGKTSDQPPLNDNNHHAAHFEFKGKWYEVYHNRIVANEAGIPTGFRRNIALDSFDFDDKGKIIKKVPTFDGVVQVGFLDPFDRVEGETFNAQKGIETEPCKAGGMNLCDIQNGDWVKLRGVNFGDGVKSFTASVAGNKGGKIEVRVGGPEGLILGTCDVAAAGESQEWKEVGCSIRKVTGAIDLCLKFVGDEGDLFSIDWWQFRK